MLLTVDLSGIASLISDPTTGSGVAGSFSTKNDVHHMNCCPGILDSHNQRFSGSLCGLFYYPSI